MNKRIARLLFETADLLARRGNGNPHRIRAYRQAAEALLHLAKPIEEVFREGGEAGIREALNVGERLARLVRQIIVEGRFALLERLRTLPESDSVLETVPGLGAVWSRHLKEDLGIHTLEDLETAAYDGRLEHAAGMGAKRLAGIRDSLASRLARVRPAPASQGAAAGLPPVAELFDVDREYRESAAAGKLRLIAPRRFNPERAAWLPILHTQRGDRRYTALYSNTARAHQAGKTKDWVVLYEEGPAGARSWTVITSSRGPLVGRRIVRGRENECAAYYSQPSAAQAA